MFSLSLRFTSAHKGKATGNGKVETSLTAKINPAPGHGLQSTDDCL